MYGEKRSFNDREPLRSIWPTQSARPSMNRQGLSHIEHGISSDGRFLGIFPSENFFQLGVTKDFGCPDMICHTVRGHVVIHGHAICSSELCLCHLISPGSVAPAVVGSIQTSELVATCMKPVVSVAVGMTMQAL